MKNLIDKLLSWCTLPILGLVITACYLLGAVWLLSDRIEQLKGMPLNEVGDFLSGIFGALAFFWLVIGYVIQNSELKNQILEFKKNLDFQKETESRKVSDFRRIAQPIFEIKDTLNIIKDIDDTLMEAASTPRFIHLKYDKTPIDIALDKIFKNKNNTASIQRRSSDDEDTIRINLKIVCIKNEIYNLEIINKYSEKPRLIKRASFKPEDFINPSKRPVEEYYQEVTTSTKKAILKEKDVLDLDLDIARLYIKKLLLKESLIFTFTFEDVNREKQAKLLVISHYFFRSEIRIVSKEDLDL